MIQEDKDLLLKDLCARLPYRVLFMVYDNEINEPVELLSINPKRDKPLEIDDGYDENSSTYWNLEDVKPYLRPMSSMTREEHAYYVYYQSRLRDGILGTIGEYLDWLNKNMFDYSGLIERGLVLEAPEGMYNIK